MEIDAATEFANGWDTLAIQQWLMTGNEYAVLSTVPLTTKERARVDAGAEVELPRQCAIKVGSEGVPVSYRLTTAMPFPDLNGSLSCSYLLSESIPKINCCVFSFMKITQMEKL